MKEINRVIRQRDRDMTFKLKPMHMTLLFKEAVIEFFNPHDALVFFRDLLELTNPSRILPPGPSL